MSGECIFCKIAKGEMPADKLFEDEEIVAFKDINPAAPTHILIVPKAHIPTLNDIQADKLDILTKMISAARNLAKKAGIAEKGYRTVINCNREAGQEIFHMHLHVIGGRPLGKMA